MDTDEDEYFSDCVSDHSEDEVCSVLLSKNLVPKLTGRKANLSEARWIAEGRFAGMAEVTKVKGQLLRTTGVVRERQILLHVEEIGYLMQREALVVYFEKTTMTMMDLFSFIMKNEYGCTWDAFKVYVQLKKLGYIVARHKVPWSDPNVAYKRQQMTSPNGELSSCFKEVAIRESEDRERHHVLVFDVFGPNSRFRKTNAGVPEFSVFISSGKPPSLADMETLRAGNEDVPIMIASVDCGRVAFFQYDETQLPLLP